MYTPPHRVMPMTHLLVTTDDYFSLWKYLLGRYLENTAYIAY